MRDIYEVLREKEAAMKRVKIEVLALRLAGQLIAEDAATDMIQPEPLLEQLEQAQPPT